MLFRSACFDTLGSVCCSSYPSLSDQRYAVLGWFHQSCSSTVMPEASRSIVAQNFVWAGSIISRSIISLSLIYIPPLCLRTGTVRVRRPGKIRHKIARAVKTASSAKSGASQTGVRWDGMAAVALAKEGRLQPLTVDCPRRRGRVVALTGEAVKKLRGASALRCSELPKRRTKDRRSATARRWQRPEGVRKAGALWAD